MVLRIAGINLNDDKKVKMAITAIYGIGRTNNLEVLEKANIEPTKKVSELTEDEQTRLRMTIEKEMLVEGDLRRDLAMNIKRLRDINSYRGSRHAQKLPARGQRTKNNARTKRGKKVTMGSGKKKAADKT
ncbi:MAG: 30S ribosomal protein S13 [Patescibacteria group bacterium]